MRGIPTGAVRAWRLRRWFLGSPAESAEEATSRLPPLSAGPAAYVSLFARTKELRAPALEQMVSAEGPLRVMPVYGLGDLLVPVRVSPLLAATRGFVARRNARRTARWRAAEHAHGALSAQISSTLSRQPAAVGHLSSAPGAGGVLDEMARRGRALKVPLERRLDGRFAFSAPPADLGRAADQTEGYEFLRDLAFEYFGFAGPATRDDFCWWSGVSAAASRHSIEDLAGLLEEVDIEGQRQAFFMREEDAADMRNARAAGSARPALLPSLDCTRFALRAGMGALCDERFAARFVPPARRARGGLSPGPRFFTSGGGLCGTWTLQRGPRHIAHVPLRPLSLQESDAVEAAASALSDFLDDQLPWAVSRPRAL